jgi:hypothetical protein
VIDVDELEVIELLQQEMRGIVIDAATLVAVELVEKHLKSQTVEHILTGVNLEADIGAGRVKRVEDRLPASGEFGEGFID